MKKTKNVKPNKYLLGYNLEFEYFSWIIGMILWKLSMPKDLLKYGILENAVIISYWWSVTKMDRDKIPYGQKHYFINILI